MFAGMAYARVEYHSKWSESKSMFPYFNPRLVRILGFSSPETSI